MNIHFICRGNVLRSLVVDRSQAGSFYEVIPAGEVARRYPINSPLMTVALHTRYDIA